MRLSGDTSPRRIAHVVSELRPGGVEIRLLELMKYLGKEAEEHTVLTVSGRKGPLAGEFERLGVRVIPQKMRSLSYAAHFAATIISEKPTVVQVYLNSTSGLQMLLAWCIRVPVRVTSFRSDGKVPQSSYLRIRRNLTMFLIRRFSTDIVGVSPSTLDANIAAWRNDNRCQVIVNGFPEIASENGAAVGLRSLLPGQPNCHPILAHVGRADVPTKNRERAIVIAAKLKAMGCPHHLVFIGRHGATQEDALANLDRWCQLADKSGVKELVHFLGERKDVRTLLGDADCLLVTSTLEGLPGVIVESLLEDTPVVTSDIPGSLFLSTKLPGIECVSLGASDLEWAETVLRWRLACSKQVRERQLSKAVADSEFNIRRQVQYLRQLWGTDA